MPPSRLDLALGARSRHAPKRLLKIDPRSGQDLAKAYIDDLGTGIYDLKYQPMGHGPYQVHVAVNGESVRGSPFTATIAQAGAPIYF